jgi:hypothetical protein
MLLRIGYSGVDICNMRFVVEPLLTLGLDEPMGLETEIPRRDLVLVASSVTILTRSGRRCVRTRSVWIGVNI